MFATVDAGDGVPFFQCDFTQPDPISEEGKKCALAVMESGRLFRYQGYPKDEAANFETEFADFLGCRFAIALNSGGSAMFLALKGAGVQAGDRVLVIAFTLTPAPSSIIHAGAMPVLVECDENPISTCRISAPRRGQMVLDT